MARALQLAARGLYGTDPNPRVGCVIVRDGQVVGEGWHQRAGEPHAEVFALRAAGEQARGATAYVTLEPCAHHGRTPPCAEALIAAGVARVVAAMEDPFPQVAGKGLQMLRDAGIATEVGLMAAEAEQLNIGFVSRLRRGRPWVRLKMAMSLDGRTAMANGDSKWISCDAARADVQRLRARSSAIVTGIGTVLADDPQLNVRLDGCTRQPLRVVLDSGLKMSPRARMLSLAGETWVATATSDEARRQALRQQGARVFDLPRSASGLDLNALLAELSRASVNEVLVEAGPTLAGAFVAAGLVDELVIYQAPHLMGDGGRGLLHLPGLACMQDRIALQMTDVRQVGDTLRLTLRPK